MPEEKPGKGRTLSPSFVTGAIALVFLAIGYQPFEFITLFHLGSGDTFIGINVDKLIFGMLLGIVTVVPYLCCKGMELIGRVA